jgi:3-deoxy-7-phosphoheptulonate synthase
MVIILHQHIRPDQKEHIRSYLTGHGYAVKEIVGSEETIFGAVGPARLDIRDVEVLPGVARVIPISKPYKLASRELVEADSVVDIGPVRIGAGRVVVIAGPCAVESRDGIMESAAQVREAGAVILRGGAFKPRTSPYSFQGLGEEGLKFLKEAGERYGMPVVSEIVSPTQVDLMRDYVDMLQIGARNMQNFELLKAVGASGIPVLLKRGLAARIEEWLMAAEYLMAHGNESVVLCERGIRSFETYTRNSLDLSSIPVVKKLSHLPILVDPSHATGIREKVMPMAMASVAAGADGVMIEVHPDPDHARSDGAQSLYPAQFEKLVRDVEALCPVLHKELYRLPSQRRPEAASAGKDRRPAPGRGDSEAGLTPRIAFQGEAGAYSEMALQRYFSRDGGEFESLPCPEFKHVFEKVFSGDARFGILPIENALTGSIHENYDLLLQYPDISICGETRIRIQHSLIGLPGVTIDDITAVFSHPQGLAQCSRFLEGYPGIERRPYYDTAGSVAFIAREGRKDYAAIANSLAARVYGMETIREGIETNPVNYTRFVIITRREADREEPGVAEGAERATIVFSVQDKPGALLKCMELLSARNLNLSKIESRPIHGKPWEYMFYLDVDVEGRAGAFMGALEDMGEFAEDIRILGLYPRG